MGSQRVGHNWATELNPKEPFLIFARAGINKLLLGPNPPGKLGTWFCRLLYWDVATPLHECCVCDVLQGWIEATEITCSPKLKMCMKTCANPAVEVSSLWQGLSSSAWSYGLNTYSSACHPVGLKQCFLDEQVNPCSRNWSCDEVKPWKVKVLVAQSCLIFCSVQTIFRQPLLSMGFRRQEYWSE